MLNLEQSLVGVVFQRREMCSCKFCVMLKKAVLESFGAVFLLPQLCHILHSELPELGGASSSHLSQSERRGRKANSSFTLEIRKKSEWKRLQ